MESHVFIIAEAGVNHNGNLEIAKKMIDVAKEAGADAIKFQSFVAEKLVCKSAPKAEYQLQTTSQDESQYQMLKKLELSAEYHKELIRYCNAKKIMFLSTPFDIQSAKTLYNLSLPIIKIPSGEITNLPYLREIGKMKRKVILSTGMSTLDEVRDAIQVLRDNGTEEIITLHCNTQYPTPMEDVNLKVMLTMKEKLHVPVGYSDHTQGIEVAIAAVAMGAVVIEKHFTLNRNMEGPDHKASLEPDELNRMIYCIRNIEKALGTGVKKVTSSEQENREIARKSIVAAKNIVKGEKFAEDNITVKRPGTGINPMRWDSIIGKIADKNYNMDEMIKR